MTTGAHVGAHQALEWGVVDEVVRAGGDVVGAAVTYCKAMMGKEPKRVSYRPVPRVHN